MVPHVLTDSLPVQMCCGGWGDVSLPTSAGEIEAYASSTRGREPIPEWLIEIIRILADEGEAKFKPLKIREPSRFTILNCFSYWRHHRTLLVHTLPGR